MTAEIHNGGELFRWALSGFGSECVIVLTRLLS